MSVDGSPVSRHEALARVEEWWEAVQREEIRPDHPLVGVQSLRLVAAGDAGPHRQYGRETRPSSKSRPLVRDLPGGVRRMDKIMRDIAVIDLRYHRALVHLAEHRGLVSRVADSMQVSRPTAFRYVDVGLGMVQISLLRGNHP